VRVRHNVMTLCMVVKTAIFSAFAQSMFRTFTDKVKITIPSLRPINNEIGYDLE